MKTKTNYIARPIPTLTQSGLLSELLRYERLKVTELTRRRARCERTSGPFAAGLSQLLARARDIADRGRRFRRGLRQPNAPRPT